MFVKVAYARGESSIYECSHVHVLNLSKNKVAFEMERENEDACRLDINKSSGSEVYLMNNEGKTIDVYRWPPGNSSEESETFTQ